MMSTQANSIKKIAIVKLSALGDVILSVPLVRTLQTAFPDAEITWIIDRSVYPILKGLSGVNFIVIDKPENIRDYLAFRRRMRPYTFDVLLAVQASFRANFLYPFIKAKRKIGFDNKARDLHSLFVKETVSVDNDHLLRSFIRFGEKIGAKELNISWDLPLPEEDRKAARAMLPDGPVIAINPRASKVERNWLFERYVSLIHEIEKRYQIPVVLTGAPSDKPYAARIEERANVINLVGKTSQKQLACVLENVQVLIAPDTGPAHIATAVGTPVIGLYAVAPAKLSGPYFSDEFVIDKYDEAVRQILKKDPTTIPWKTRVHDEKAMALITVDDVLEKLDKVLSQS